MADEGLSSVGLVVFERGEDPPPQEPGAETARLAELGELTPEEVAGRAEE